MLDVDQSNLNEMIINVLFSGYKCKKGLLNFDVSQGVVLSKRSNALKLKLDAGLRYYFIVRLHFLFT